MSIDARLQVRAADLLDKQLRKLGRTKGGGCGHGSGEWGSAGGSQCSRFRRKCRRTCRQPDADDTMLDRARYGLYPPGSSFKVVTAMAALRKDPKNVDQQYECKACPTAGPGIT